MRYPGSTHSKRSARVVESSKSCLPRVGSRSPNAARALAVASRRCAASVGLRRASDHTSRAIAAKPSSAWRLVANSSTVAIAAEGLAQVRKLTDGQGVDRVVEVGGPATFDQSLRAVAIGGEVTLIGFLSEENPGIDYFLLKGSGAITRSITVRDRTDSQDLVRAVATTGLEPVIDDIFEFSDARAAFERLREAKQLGKLVIRVS
jgi:NADPH:quinone reductase-like Zn-dependent oxidoreductase